MFVMFYDKATAEIDTYGQTLPLHGALPISPAAANPRLSAVFNGASTSGGTFRFTPASSASNRRGVRVAVRARATTKEEAQRIADAPSPSIAPTAYNLGVAVGWKRFALSGEKIGRAHV